MTLVKRPRWEFAGRPAKFSSLWDDFPSFDYSKENMPAVNVQDNDGNFQIEVAAPGLAKKDFDISIENGYLVISSEKEESKEEQENNYSRMEFSYNAFKRSLLLPENADQDSVGATYKDGILNITIDKIKDAEEAATKSIKIS